MSGEEGTVNQQEQPRVRTLTQPGEALYADTKGRHLANIAAIFAKIDVEIQTIETNRNDKKALRQIKTCISDLITKYEAAVQECKDYFQRTNTAQSLEDRNQLEEDTNTRRAKMDEVLTQLQELTAVLQETASRSSCRSSMRARAEAAKAKLEYARKAADLKKKRAALDAELDVLDHERELAVAVAEADAFESAKSVHNEALDKLPGENKTARTAAYVNKHADPAPIKPPTTPQATFQEDLTTTKAHETNLNPLAPTFIPDWTTLLLRKELLMNRMISFNDKPESFMAWKETFHDVAHELRLSPREELDLLIKWLGPESKKHAISIKTSNARDPQRALQYTWERLLERYGAPEKIEASLKTKLAAFPKLTNKDSTKLYELADLLSEIESTKEDPQYHYLLSYYDTSSGVNPIVSKLPQSLQDKWTNHAVRYTTNHDMYFPPFSEFVQFIRNVSKVRNNPCFVYNNDTTTTLPSGTKKERVYPPKENYISSRKTDVSDSTANSQTPRCPIHQTRHSLADCRGFREKPIDERRQILKNHGCCFKCTTKGHMTKDCETAVHCDCGSDRHPTALHVDGEETRNRGGKPSIDKKEDPANKPPSDKKTPVNSKCTQICGNSVLGKSCAKMVLVKVFHEDNPAKAVKTYAIIDDQSNRSLAKSDLFDALDIHGNEIEYTLTSCNGRVTTTGRKAHGLIVESLHGNTRHELPALIECNQIPNTKEEIPTPEVARYYPHLHDIEANIAPVDDEAEILMLIGRDLIEAHHVLDQRIGPSRVPYAQQLSLGWVIIGESCLGGAHQPENVVVNKTSVLSNNRPSHFTPCPNIYDAKEHFDVDPPQQIEFCTKEDVFARAEDDDKPGLSVEDREFLKIMKGQFVRNQEGSWVAPLPFRSQRPKLPNNRSLAMKRAKTLGASLRRDPLKKQHLVTFMKGIFDAGHAEIAPPLKGNEEGWYLPIFGVYHPKKPDRIRGVFDSSAKFDGLSLNDVLLSGPDYTNNLLSVLLRFRREPVAIMADIEQMFYGFKVDQKHRNFLRFFWNQDNDPDKELAEYRMCVHVFGNSSSPAVATYGLRKTAQIGEKVYGSDMKTFVEQDFYVDDGLTSLPTSQQAVDLLKRTQQALRNGGNLRLHKIASNSDEVMRSFPAEDLAKDLRGLDMIKNTAPTQRSLGVSWNIKTDTFTFKVSNDERPDTRRGILSTVNSLFDPMGFLAPVTIQGKLLLRDVTSTTADWDAPLPQDLLTRWQKWKQSLQVLNDLQIPRAYTSTPLPTIQRELHIFADASEKAIAAVAYMKTTCETDEQISIVLGKAKVAPKHAITMPRMELCAALLATEIGSFIQDNLKLTIDTTYYSDSKVVLGYINNRTRRFYVYVANRVQRILKHSRPDQWKYVPTNLNPADLGTRAIPADSLMDSGWLQGPDFLRATQNPTELLPSSDEYTIAENDTEVVALATTINDKTSLGTARFARFSKWISLVKAIARLIHLATTLTGIKRRNTGDDRQDVSLNDMERAEKLILQEAQHQSFRDEITALKNGSKLSRNSVLAKLDPYLDSEGLLRVGGRLRLSEQNSEQKHPIIIDRSQHIATLLVRHHHEEVKHQGRHFTEGAIRSAGIWIIGAKRLVSTIIHKCVLCRKLRRKLETQKMANLPADRLEPGPPFTNVGIDTFGPWNVTARRTRGGQANSKRWAILFTCLTTRAIHIELVEELSSSSFINALRRLYAIRGKAKVLRSDCGTNFTGCANLLREHLKQNGTEWVFNPPHASHMGGAWERMIGIIRRILDSMMLQMSGKALTHEVLVTLMAEVSAIVNARPLVSVSTDPDDPQILTPATLLTQKTGEEIHLDTDSKDLYQAQWKRVQALANMFWQRWSSQYLNSLQGRRKWTDTQRNAQEGDIVLLKDRDLHRNAWPVGLVNKTFKSEDGLVRKVDVRVWRGDKHHVYSRPITEVIILVEKDS